MIESYFPQETVLKRLRSGPIGPYLPRFVRTLEQRRFSPDTIRRYLRGADRLGRWLQGQGIALAEANQNDLQTYVRQYARLPHTGYTQGRLSQAALSVPRIASVLREQGLFCGSVPTSKADAWLARFDDHLVRVHGLSRYSRDNYVRYARRLIQSLQGSEPDWSRLGAAHLSDFIRREASRLKPGSCRQPVTAIRALLRFLVAEGAIAPNLSGAIPAIREWRDASLPQAITPEELQRVLELCCTPTVGGLRDACIVLLMARLGLRAGEVRQLKLDDIDWIEGVIHVRAGKSRRERALPLVEGVGKMLSAYLQQERPQSAERFLFLTSLPPYRPLGWSTTITRMSKRMLQKAGVEGPHLGAHRLRHTVATHLVRGGSSFKEVADVLGPKALRSTGIYAKLDERRLEQIALPWPGGAQ